MMREDAGTIDGIPCVKTSVGKVNGLPEPVDGTWLLVSRIVKDACPERSDLVCVGETDRTYNKDGSVTIVVKSLER